MTRISIERSEFAHNWDASLGEGGQIDLHKDTAGLSGAERRALQQADANGDGVLTRDEAWRYVDRTLDANHAAGARARVSDRGVARDYRAALAHVFAKRAGAGATVGGSDVLYLQFNNPNDARLVEAGDLQGYVARDPDHPHLTTRNLTCEFNTEGDKDAATAAFKSQMRRYLDNLIATGGRMSGFVISGHSDGVDLLQDAGDHTYYRNLDVRQALRELRAENTAYARLFDNCEKVGLLACFQGGHYAEWTEIFPNATIAGTSEFAPLSSTHSSGAIYNAAATAHQVLEDGGSAARAEARGVRVSGHPSHLVVTPNAEAARRRVAAVFAARRKDFERAQPDIGRIRASEPDPRTGQPYSADAIRNTYRVVNRYLAARRSLWVVDGRAGGEHGPEAQALEYLDFLMRDLFGCRRDLQAERPIHAVAPPPGFSSTPMAAVSGDSAHAALLDVHAHARTLARVLGSQIRLLYSHNGRIDRPALAAELARELRATFPDVSAAQARERAGAMATVIAGELDER